MMGINCYPFNVENSFNLWSNVNTRGTKKISNLGQCVFAQKTARVHPSICLYPFFLFLFFFTVQPGLSGLAKSSRQHAAQRLRDRVPMRMRTPRSTAHAVFAIARHHTCEEACPSNDTAQFHAVSALRMR